MKDNKGMMKKFLIILFFPFLFSGCSWPGYLTILNPSETTSFTIVLHLPDDIAPDKRDYYLKDRSRFLDRFEVAKLKPSDTIDSDLSWQLETEAISVVDRKAWTISFSVPSRTAIRFMLAGCCNGYLGGPTWFESIEVKDTASGKSRLRMSSEYFAQFFREVNKANRIFVLKEVF